MTLIELTNKLSQNNVPQYWYSLDEGLKPDACILYKNHSKWEFFYLDERGNRNDFHVFHADEEAFEYLWKKMECQLSVFGIKPRSK